MTPSRTTARRLEPITVAADYLGVSTKTIRRFIARGRLTGYRVGSKMIRVDLNQVDALLRESEIPTTGGGSDAA